MIPLNTTLNFRRPSDIRTVMQGDRKLQILLSMIYEQNELCSKAGYNFTTYSDHCRKYPGRDNSYYREAALQASAKRKLISKQITDYCKFHGLTADRNVSGRIKAVRYRKSSGKNGAIVNLSQKGLFMFSGMYDAAGRPNILNSEFFA